MRDGDINGVYGDETNQSFLLLAVAESCWWRWHTEPEGNRNRTQQSRPAKACGIDKQVKEKSACKQQREQTLILLLGWFRLAGTGWGWWNQSQPKSGGSLRRHGRRLYLEVSSKICSATTSHCFQALQTGNPAQRSRTHITIFGELKKVQTKMDVPK